MRAKRVLVIALGCAALFVAAAAVAVVLFHPGDLKVFDSPDASAAVGSGNPHHGGVRAEGRVVTPPGQKVELGTEVGGTIRELHVQEGDTVEKGDVLVEFDDTEQRAALSEARAAVHASNARAGFHVKEARRLKELENSGAVPKRELDRVRSERNASFGDTAVAMGAVKRLEAALAKLVIRAPIDGTVIACGVDEGETRPPGAHLLTVANLDELRVEAEVDEFDVGRVAVGGEAIVTAEGFDQSWRGKVEEVPRASSEA